MLNSPTTTTSPLIDEGEQPPKIIPPDERLCSECFGLKYVLPAPRAGKFESRAIPCPAGCNLAQNRLKLRGISQVPEAQQGWYLRGATFHPSIQNEIERIKNLLYGEDPAGFWYIHGPNGVGKSYILVAAVNEAIRQQRSAVYITTSKLIDLVRHATIDGGYEKEQTLLDRINSVTVLALDEFGRERDTEFSLEKLFDILDNRYRSAHQYSNSYDAKLTLIGSNFFPDHLAGYLKSRLGDENSHVFSMKGLADRRKARK